MQLYELLDFPVPWERWCSSSLHDLVQSQGEIRTIGMVIPAVLCVVLAQGHEISLGSFALPGFPESWRDGLRSWCKVVGLPSSESFPETLSYPQYS